MPSSDMSAWMAEIERRIRDVEVAARANQTSVRGGSIRLVRADGTGASVMVGSNGGGEAGIWLVDEDGQTIGYLGTDAAGTIAMFGNDDATAASLHVEDGQLRFPITAAAFQKDPYVEQDTYGWARTSNTAYTTCWRGVMPITTGHIYGVVDIVPDVGATVDVRVAVANFFNPVEVMPVAELTGITSQDLLAGAWAIPDGLRGTPGESSIGATAEVMIQARRSAGADSASVAPRLPFAAIVL